MLVPQPLGKGLQTMMHTKSVQRSVWLVLFVLMAPLLPDVAATEGRSTIVTLEIPRHDWTSEEVVEIDLRLRNAPYNEMLRAEWVLRDAQGINTNGTILFTAAGTFTVVDVNLSTYYRGEHFNELSVVVYDSSGTVLGSSDLHFVVFRNVKMASAGSLLAFGDSLSDMGNAKASILNTPDVPPYWQGRFSNGEVWLGGLYDAYGLTSSIGSGWLRAGPIVPSEAPKPGLVMPTCSFQMLGRKSPIIWPTFRPRFQAMQWSVCGPVETISFTERPTLIQLPATWKLIFVNLQVLAHARLWSPIFRRLRTRPRFRVGRLHSKPIFETR